MRTQLDRLFAAFGGSVLVLGCLVARDRLRADDPKPAPALDDYRRAVSSDGAAGRGAKLFGDNRSTCGTCHTTDGRGGKVGPDLRGIADKLDRDGLVRAVLEPSADVLPGYESTVVITRSEVSHVGVLKYAGEREIELGLADGKTVRVARADIDEIKTSRQSLMPDKLHANLSPTEFADLIAYLETLRLPPPTTAARPDNPDAIARARKPLAVAPFVPAESGVQRPVWFGPLAGRDGEYLAVEIERARVWRIAAPKGAGAPQKHLFVDLHGQTRHGYIEGILGFALHPQFAQNRRYFVAMHDPARDKVVVNVWERRADKAGTADDGGAPKKLLSAEMPHVNHNGCCLEFGPDGMLYVSFGDGGPQEDPSGYSQDLGSPLGKILRIDVGDGTGDRPYTVPDSNPFRKAKGARPELWALGFREPWRFTFDRKNGELWVGDVGQNRFEMVAVVRAGENHGWNVYEGFEPFSPKFRRTGETYVPPVLSYSHRHGVSVTGGYVYRGKKAPAVEGMYVFGDYETRKIWGLTRADGKLSGLVELGRSPSRIAAFGEDVDGELFLIGHDPHAVYRLDLSAADPTPLLVRDLVATSEKAGLSWRYTLTEPPAKWAEPGFDAAAWKSSPGGFGTRGTPGAVVRTEWRTADIWLRREFTLSQADITGLADGTLAVRMHHDEDAEVYVNGVLAVRAPGFTGNYIELPVEAVALKALKAGTNTLAVRCHQTVGGQYIDVGLIQYQSVATKSK